MKIATIVIISIILFVSSLVLVSAAGAILAPGKVAHITVTETRVGTYVYAVSGDKYDISLLGINMAGRNSTATLWFKRSDSKGNLLRSSSLNLLVGQGYRMCAQVNNKGQNICPAFRLQKIQPSYCLPRTNKCSEDAVLLSVV